MSIIPIIQSFTPLMLSKNFSMSSNLEIQSSVVKGRSILIVDIQNTSQKSIILFVTILHHNKLFRII